MRSFDKHSSHWHSLTWRKSESREREREQHVWTYGGIKPKYVYNDIKHLLFIWIYVFKYIIIFIYHFFLLFWYLSSVFFQFQCTQIHAYVINFHEKWKKCIYTLFSMNISSEEARNSSLHGSILRISTWIARTKGKEIMKTMSMASSRIIYKKIMQYTHNNHNM